MLSAIKIAIKAVVAGRFIHLTQVIQYTISHRKFHETKYINYKSTRHTHCHHTTNGYLRISIYHYLQC